MKSLLLLLCAAIVPAALVQDPQGADPTKPLPQHAPLLHHVGVWDATMKFYMPDGTAQTAKATQTTKKVGELHTVDDFSGIAMGMPFTGHGTNSYCPVRKKYVGTWVDSWTPSPLLVVGDYDEKKNELTSRGEMVDQTGKMVPCKTVTRWLDDNRFWFGMYSNGADGKEALMMEIEYARKK